MKKLIVLALLGLALVASGAEAAGRGLGRGFRGGFGGRGIGGVGSALLAEELLLANQSLAVNPLLPAVVGNRVAIGGCAAQQAALLQQQALVNPLTIATGGVNVQLGVPVPLFGGPFFGRGVFRGRLR
jgi:hypothetical protein